ncbi:MAG: tRNA 2-thiouridine(34) synthase MnmA [Muribaculaceae bacterium]|nr:tRNA 2-thiouridine(34) synthase MnmA [Muribaculaceae bacterium]
MRIAVLVSGGVDSAVVVDKLYREGHELTLFYIRIGMDNDEGDCSAEEDIEFCSLIASRYELPLKIVSLHQEYWDYVMGYALDSVKRGLTPNPDMMCNKFIKFGFFEQRYGKDFDKTASGHYAGVEEIGGRKFLVTAPDPVKDQTDFLSAISYEQLCHVMFPIGSMPKKEVRELALKAALPNATRRDSQGICFLGKIDYRDFISRKLGVMEGNVVDIDSGKVIGTHNGHWLYTIGQRKGLGLGGGPWFVIRKDIATNTLYVSKGYETPLQYKKEIPLEPIHWISGDPCSDDDLRKLPFISDNFPLEGPASISFKIRHTPDFTSGNLVKDKEGWIIMADRDIQGVAPGQYATIYTPDRHICLGSAMIASRATTE